MNRKVALFSVLTAVVLLFTLVMAGMNTAQAGPTTPTNIVKQACAAPGVQTLYSAVVTQTTRGPVISNALVGPYCSLVDVQWSITVGSANTVTLAYQVSNDNSTWVTGTTLTSTIAATANDLQEVSNFGLYNSLYASLSTTAPVTITAIGLYK